MNIQTAITSSSQVLTECAITERHRRAGDVELHPTLFNTPLIYHAIFIGGLLLPQNDCYCPGKLFSTVAA